MFWAGVYLRGKKCSIKWYHHLSKCSKQEAPEPSEPNESKVLLFQQFFFFIVLITERTRDNIYATCFLNHYKIYPCVCIAALIQEK